MENNKATKERILTANNYVHLDNGGYFFCYDLTNKALIVETSFFGYSQNTHIFQMTIKELEKLIFSFKQYWTRSVKEHSGNGWKIDDAGLTLTSSESSVVLTFLAPNVRDPIVQFDNLIVQIKKINNYNADF